MSFRKILTGLTFAGALFAAAGAQAGGSSTPNTADVFTPGTSTVVAAAFAEARTVLSGGGSLTTTPTAGGGTTATLPSGTTITVSGTGGTITVTPAGGGAPITLSSSFVASFLAGFL
ncbi:hypothetical protein [Roseicyclus marinus]|uniref:hypothetical protein n=1 Tax=Roseicyclus marinus TaxID=2161673 RepID=UPI00240F05BD|nr:hypothetical protein [Roseicyclus marinus]MDG3039715.1 hypothetical protein [Roseicyclus marinus]